MDEELKILLIEDDEVDRIAVKRGLKSSGFNVSLVMETNAILGMERLKATAFDCIFLDYMLPGKDGLTFMKEVREAGIDTPIVILTSKGDEKIAVEMMKAGASDYFPKSLLTAAGLSRSLRGALRQSKLLKEKNATERALREKEEQLKNVIEAAPMILFVIDLEGRFLLLEGAALKKLKLKPGDLIGKSALAANRSYPKVLAHIQKGLKGEIFTDLVKVDEIYFETSYSPLYDERQKLIGTTGIAVDITSHIEAEQKLTAAKKLAEKSAKSREDFLANMSHEIRTPMNAIIGFSKLLMKTPLTEEQREYLKAINSSGDTLMVIINDILDLSKIEAGKLRFEVRDFNLRELLISLEQIFIPKIREKNLLFHIKVESSVPKMIVGDSVRLNQILLNLVGNAIKFTEKGKIGIFLREISRKNGLSKIEFHIQDTGIGIAKSKQLEIFESFSQASTDTTRKFGGTGLGLTICKRLIELQGGEIKVESEEGQGSEFSFFLEFKVSQNRLNGDSETETEAKIIPRGDLKILLVEDNLLNQVLAKKVLMSFGMNFELAENGKEALEILPGGDFDLVLMDVQMPIMDGYEAASRIRSDFAEPLASIPIIALTAHAVSEEIEKCRAAGMNEYSAKPFQPKELYLKIVELTGPLKPTQVEPEPTFTDLTYLYELADGSNEFLGEMMDIFLDRIPAFLTELAEQIESEKWPELYQSAHGIKPTYLTFGIVEGKEIAGEIETIAKNEGYGAGLLPGLLEKLTVISGPALDEIKHLRSELEPKVS